MVKANSLLYAIYICLIVSIICGALLYCANLYSQLNLFYNLEQELYINNQSVVNFALGHKTITEVLPIDENLGITGSYQAKSYGLLTLLLAQSSVRNDTVASAHFVGAYVLDKTAIHLSNFSKPLSYFGVVKLIGDNQLPSITIDKSYISNKANQLMIEGRTTISDELLPEINPNFKKLFNGIATVKTSLKEVDKPKDSLYYNSFFNKTKEIYLTNSVVSNMIFKGNFVLRSKDSIRVRKNVVLEDVILIAPKITFEEGFKGTVQAFATKGIELGQKVVLNYPSVICVYSNKMEECKIKIKKESKISGALVLFGNTLALLDKNTIEFDEGCTIMGTVYCSGKLLLKSKVYGSVYTNRFFYKTTSSSYDNMIADVEINSSKRPSFFIAIPLFDVNKQEYGVIKKVL